MYQTISLSAASSVQRNAAFDVLKLILAVMVVGAHTYVLHSEYPQDSFLLYNGLFRIAVPLFFIMNGFFLPSPNTPQKYKSSIVKIILLYGVWMALYSPIYVNIAMDIGLKFLAKDIIMGYWHLWYLAALIQALIILYMIRNIPARAQLILVFSLYTIGSAIQYYAFFYQPEKVPYFIYRNALFFGLPFIVMGYQYEHIRSTLEKYKCHLLAVGLLALCLEVYLTSLHPHEELGFDSYFSLILLCPAIFSFVRAIPPFSVPLPLGKLSTAIYLVHPFYIFLAYKLGYVDGSQLFIFTLVASSLTAIPLIFLSRKLRFLL
jgi:Predicted acyltransferases